MFLHCSPTPALSHHPPSAALSLPLALSPRPLFPRPLQLAGSDSLKAAIVEAGGVPVLVACMRAFIRQPAVVVEVRGRCREARGANSVHFFTGGVTGQWAAVKEG